MPEQFRQLPLELPATDSSAAKTIFDAPRQMTEEEAAQLATEIQRELDERLAQLRITDRRWDPGLDSIRFIPGSPSARMMRK